MELKQLFTFAAACSLALSVSAQDRVHYTGTELSNPTCHDGQLSPVVGVHNIQVMRANREHPAPDNGNGWTYNHQSMLAYWNGQFYMHYLSDPSDEHIPPSQTFLMTSKDGYHWTNPVTLFPIYRVPDGYTKPGRTDKAKDLDAKLVHWCAKETVFKLFSEEKLMFEDMRVKPFDTMADWSCDVENLKSGKMAHVDFELTMEFVLTYAAL